jgi:hypothetical protein
MYTVSLLDMALTIRIVSMCVALVVLTIFYV